MLLLFALIFASWAGAQADIGLTLSRQYLPADQATNGPPDRQYLPSSEEESSNGHFGSTNQFARFDDEDSVSVTSALFAGARTVPGVSSRRLPEGPSNQYAVSGPSSRTGGGPSEQNGYSGSSNRFGGTPSNQYATAFASGRSGGFNFNRVGISGSSGGFTASSRSGGYSNQNGIGNRFGNAPSNQYGTPTATSRFAGTPSSQYGVPSTSSRFGSTLSGRNGASSASSRIGNAPSNQYGVPEASVRSGGASVPSNRFNNSPSTNGFARSGGSAPSRQYGAPSGFNRNIGGTISGQNGGFGPSGRAGNALSTEYGVPSTSGGSNGFPSGQYASPSVSSRFGSAASSATFGSSNNFRSSAPSVRYGTPGATADNSQGYQYNSAGAGFRNANEGGFGDKDPLSEPANYEFSYEVEARDYGTEFGHEESRQYDDARGSYHVLLPDGRIQIVEYEANQDGYKPKIRYEGEAQISGRTADGSGPY